MKEKLEISEIKSIEFQILKKIADICNKNNIKYSLAYGTLIGAIRHGGFIPWDDDIDIIILRKDVARFVQLMKMDNTYDVISSDEKFFFYPYLKISDKNTIVKEKNSTTQTGIWVDVFPLDNVPYNKIKRKIFFFNCKILRGMVLSNTTDFTSSNNRKILIKRVLSFITNIIGLNKIKVIYSKYVRKYETLSSNYISVLSTPYIGKETFSNKLLDDLVDVNFETEKFKCMKDYDKYLKQIYGEYMILPSKDKQKSHEIIVYKK